MKIFLIDDEIVALNALKKRVDWLKYGFTEVHTAQETASVREYLQNEKVDLILCDIELPGENGLALVKEVKEKYPWTECVMVTCHAEFQYIQKAMRYGVKDYILKPIDYEELEGILEKFVKERKELKNQNKIEVIVEKTQLAKKNMETVLEGDSQEARLHCVKQYIEEHIREKITVGELAELVHINEQHLMRIFKKETGQSLVEYITKQRMLLAGELLKNTDHSINFIADCVGCESCSYFTKIFKRHTGFTPREYRQQFKKS